jgi:hypothetical protein
MFLPVTGQPLHTRSMTMLVYQHDSGRWLAKGDIIDLRKTGFAPMKTSLQPAGIIHHMKIEMVVNTENLELESLVVEQPVVAIERSERSCGESCRDPAEKLQVLVGETLDDSFAKKLSETFGGPKGCSHVLALFFMMAAAVPRAKAMDDQQKNQVSGKPYLRDVGDVIFQRSLFVDGQRGEKNELVLQLGDYLTLPEAFVGASIERLGCEKSLRLRTTVDPANLNIDHCVIEDRERSWETLSESNWRNREDWAEHFTGVPVMPGLSGRAMAFCADDEDRQLLLDGLLQLAPGFIQVMAALADMWLASVKTGSSDKAVQPLGGMVDSCYIWRSGGPLAPRESHRDHDLKARSEKSSPE